MASVVVDFKRAKKYGDVGPLAKASKRIQFLKKLRKSFGGGRDASLTRGISEWVPQSVSSRLLRLASSDHDGFEQTNEDRDASLRYHRLILADLPY